MAELLFYTKRQNIVTKKRLSWLTGLLLMLTTGAMAQQPSKSLSALQQDFVDLRFGMFIHYNIPTYMNQDWPDPDASPALFNPTKLNCEQWADAAKAANMTYGCLTTKHHSGFCIWDTKTTDYNVMKSPYGKDVVKQYVDAFRKKGLKVMLYYSILDTHHKIRPGYITREKVEMIKAQLTELLTKYGEVSALIIDGWDAPWSRISYDDVPFEEIYGHIKSLQPDCLVMDLNAAKYPAEELFYTDIKSYEQGAGQHISTSTNKLPALACLPINSAWFWKTDFPTSSVKDPKELVNDIIIPYNKAYCNFILNVAPNRDGLVDDNAVAALKAIGQQWNTKTTPQAKLPDVTPPVISHNLAKFKAANSSWSDDMNIMDFANDDSFRSAWRSNQTVKQPWLEIDLQKEEAFNMVTFMEDKQRITKYHLEYFSNGAWKPLPAAVDKGRVKTARFPRVWGTKVRLTIDSYNETPAITELGVYNEKK